MKLKVKGLVNRCAEMPYMCKRCLEETLHVLQTLVLNVGEWSASRSILFHRTRQDDLPWTGGKERKKSLSFPGTEFQSFRGQNASKDTVK